MHLNKSFLKLKLITLFVTALIAVAVPGFAKVNAATKPPKIVVVGAGLGGLTAAYTLRKGGFIPEIYEGSNRVGGRCYTGKFPPSPNSDIPQVYEKGGELIDHSHVETLQLAKELGLTLDNVFELSAPGTDELFMVVDYSQVPNQNGVFPYIAYPKKDASKDLVAVWQKMKDDLQAVGYPTTYFSSTARGRELDATSLENYINYMTSELCPTNLYNGTIPGTNKKLTCNIPVVVNGQTLTVRNGAYSKLAQLLKNAYAEEFGAECSVQSPLNMLFLLGFSDPTNILLSGPSKEKYNVQGGNSLIPQKLQEYLEANGAVINFNHRLTAVYRNADSTYKVTFALPDGSNKTVDKIDRLVLGSPFSTMRKSFDDQNQPLFNGNFVDLTNAGFSPLKLYAIQNCTISNVSKLNVQVPTKFWVPLGCNGETYLSSNPMSGAGSSFYSTGSEKEFQNTWDVTRGQVGSTGIIVNYNGADYSKQFQTSDNITDVSARNTYLKGAVKTFFTSLKKILSTTPDPETYNSYTYDSIGYINNANAVNWTLDPWCRGGFSVWKTGEYCGGKGVIQPDGSVSPPGAVVPFAGVEGLPEPISVSDPILRNCHFCGEHTSYYSQGYLNGGVESGQRAANEVLNAFKKLGIQP